MNLILRGNCLKSFLFYGKVDPVEYQMGRKFMEAVQKINNNVVICRDSRNREVVAMGKGIGFGTIPREIPLSDIERTFYNVEDKYYKLVKEISPDILAFAAEIVDIAQNELDYELSPNHPITLADHIAFALERARKGIRVRMPLAYDIQQLYPREYKIAQYAIRRIQKEFKIGLPADEASGIALNFINGKMAETASMGTARYATHLQYLFERIHTGKIFQTDNAEVYEALKKELGDIYQCTKEIQKLIQKEWDATITDEEMLYLMLHINRVYKNDYFKRSVPAGK